MTSPLLTVFYDGSCRLCSTEMKALKAVDDEGRLTLVDCSAPDFDDAPYQRVGATREAMMSSIHVRDEQGSWHRGVDALGVVYGALGFTAVARWWTNRQWRPFTAAFYAWVVRHRYTLSRLRLHRLTPLVMRGIAWREARQPRCRDGACTARRV
ncbi:thiol-disulfide oxidoreductase DCC family protein [Ideonella sp. YS5]|uniref:thiol-disulfide oxidoreductase DCC family protein n=1 Tax=Ideonella sp. YS5 TaxID=3453714 RepID=UPI003EEC922C